MSHSYIFRIRIISACIFCFALLLIVRLYYIQVIQNDIYIDKADRQYSSTSRKIFSRGSIFFSNKDGTLVSAATLKSGSTITVNPEILKNPEEVYHKLNQILPVDFQSFMTKSTRDSDPYEEIAVRQTPEIGQAVDDLKIPGLKSVKDRWRFYPGNTIASHIVGILGFKGDEFAGRYGLERQFEEQLKRSDGAYVNFFAQIFSDIKTVTASTSKSEADIVTTIEPAVQTYLENLLKSTREKWSAEVAGGIIMDPYTGEVYALEVSPTFNLNHPELEKEISIFSNPLVENVYEMGSIIKPLTVSAGIDAGVITASSTYYDRGYVLVSGKRVSNFDSKERGTVGIQDLLSQSLNVGAAYVERLLGNRRFAEYMFKFGLQDKTNIELPNEARNLVNNLRGNIDIDFASASFGQGIALTPISTIKALATIANGGYLVDPHLVKRMDYKIGFSKSANIDRTKQVIKTSTAETVTRLLIYSMDNVLLNGTLKLPNYNVAVKTGTAQIAKKGGGGYAEGELLHSFVGYFPAYNPRFIILLYMVKPQGARYGSETLTIPFHETVKFLINYYEVPPDR
ncbi:MAG: penicillin-binding protein 2 [Minisyncoccia bacterium]